MRHQMLECQALMATKQRSNIETAMQRFMEMLKKDPHGAVNVAPPPRLEEVSFGDWLREKREIHAGHRNERLWSVTSELYTKTLAGVVVDKHLQLSFVHLETAKEWLAVHELRSLGNQSSIGAVPAAASSWTWATWRMRMMKNATTSSISTTSARALWSMSLKSAAFLASAPRSRLEMIRLPCAPLASKPATIVETPPPTCSPPPVPTYGTVPTVRLRSYYI